MTSSKKSRTTFPVHEDVFRQVYDSPSSLPGKERWVTPDDDVRQLEELLGMESKTIGAPLWVSGDQRHCPKCNREITWLDIVASGVRNRHSTAMIAAVILGETRYVNVETPRAIADLQCYACGTDIDGIRSFKCHNWAYAIGDIEQVLDVMARRG